MSELPGFPAAPPPHREGGEGGSRPRWRVSGLPASPVLRFVMAVLLAPPLGLIMAHAPMLLLVVAGPIGWSLMAAGFALALGAAAAMYGAMLLLGLPVLLLLAWRRVYRLAPYALAGLMAGLVTGLWLADWVGAPGGDPGGIGAVLLGFGLGLYGAWLGLCMGLVAGFILCAYEIQRRAQAAHGVVIIEQELR